MLNRIRLNENCTCCESGEEQSQRMRSKEIDRELHTAKRRMRATQKIALLGAGESGKSTFLKQMQIIHGNGFSEDEIIAYRTQIYENIMRGMAGLVNGKRELNLPWRGSFSNLKHVENGENENSVSQRMKGVLNQYNVTYKQLMEVREKESVRLNRRLDIRPEQFCKNGFVELILAIWNDHSIREAYDRRREFPKYFVENIPYFIENIDRIGSRDYVPSTADILRSRKATSTINEVEMEIKNVPFRFVDVGGQRTQRQKWQQCLADVTAILFLASASDFDEKLREDAQVNRLDESCKVFETLVNHKYLRAVEFILFLNKHDLLKQKVNSTNIQNYCVDFVGDPHSLRDVETYLQNRYKNLMQKTEVVDSGTKSSLNGGLELDSIELIENNSNRNLPPRNNHNKSIYTHFTTAIDTNNIKTIFEMVRLMIFEKNVKAIMLS